MLAFDYFGGVPADEGMPKAKAAARKALELDERLAEAHSPLGVVAMLYDWDWETAAEQHFRRALSSTPAISPRGSGTRYASASWAVTTRLSS